nr:DUF3000 domain-containing protein [Nanchangia anserum]
MSVEEIEAPAHLAPYSAAMRFDSADSQALRPASAFLVVLHHPAYQAGWNGTMRLVAHVHAEVEPEMVADPCLGQVAWQWLHSALNRAGAGYHSAAGTSTAVHSQSFGDLRLRGEQTEIELRASWTPNTSELTPHAHAIAQLLAFLAGIADPAEALGA